MGLIEQYTPSVYVETSTFNFAVAEKESDKIQAARAFFKLIGKGWFNAYTSEAVAHELLNAEATRRDKMFGLISRYGIIRIEEDAAARDLAAVYIKRGVIPQKYATDALHIAIASVNRFNFVVSYNFGHIVKLKTLNMTGLINIRRGYIRRGYPQVGLMTPEELLDYEQED